MNASLSARECTVVRVSYNATQNMGRQEVNSKQKERVGSKEG